jgi:ABC-type transporter Mla MlaB component
MLQMKPSIEDGHVVLHFGGEIDEQSAATVAEMIDHSLGDFSLDFSDVERVEDAGFTLLSEAIRRCPYKLAVRGLEMRGHPTH